ILVSSVMFFSFSSAMVMIYPRNDSPVPGHRKRIRFSVVGRFSKEGIQGRQNTTRQAGGAVLSSPPLCLGKILRLRQDFLPLRACDPVQNSIHRFLDSGAGPVELPRGLGGELAKHITIP
ncbi:MAG: hypothetical protein WB919_01320, partial [Candidatus Sulfotelmatobacter sp.]